MEENSVFETNINALDYNQKKLLLALVYNILVSDQDYADEEKYLFGNIVDYINVPFNFNDDMMSKKDIIRDMKSLDKEVIDIFLEVIRMAILADGIVTDDEVTFFKDVFKELSFSDDDINKRIDFLKYGESL